MESKSGRCRWKLLCTWRKISCHIFNSVIGLVLARVSWHHPGIYTFLLFPIMWRKHVEKGIPLKQCELWSNHSNMSLLALNTVDTHWAFTQVKNLSSFLLSFLPFILHVRALLGAAGPWPNWGLKPPSCKVVGRQTSTDLQLGAHAMPLLLWAIKGKWERDVQILLAILTYILSNRVEWLHVLTITTWLKEANLPGPNRELTWRADRVRGLG